MTPSSFFAQVAYSLMAYSILFSKFGNDAALPCGDKIADFFYIAFRELSRPMIGTFRRFKQFCFVGVKFIFRPSNPFKIANSVIRFDSVDVIAFGFVERIAYKRKKNNPANHEMRDMSIFGKRNFEVSVFIDRKHSKLVCFMAKNIASIGNRIKTFVANNIAPISHNHSPLNDSVGFAWQPSRITEFGSYPSHAKAL